MSAESDVLVSAVSALTLYVSRQEHLRKEATHESRLRLNEMSYLRNKHPIVYNEIIFNTEYGHYTNIGSNK